MAGGLLTRPSGTLSPKGAREIKKSSEPPAGRDHCAQSNDILRVLASTGALAELLAAFGKGTLLPETRPGIGAVLADGTAAESVNVKPKAFFETPWNGSRLRTQSAGSAVSGEKSATAWPSQTPLA